MRPQRVGCPLSEGPFDLASGLAATRGELPVGASEHDIPCGREIGVSLPIALELLTVETMRRPPVALDDDGRSDDPEIDLVTLDDGMELGGRKAEIVQEIPHHGLEHTVGRLPVDLPCEQRIPKHDDPMPSVFGMSSDGTVERPDVGEAGRQGMSNSTVNRRRITRTQVTERAENVRRRDTRSQNTLEVGRVAGAVNDNSSKGNHSPAWLEQDVDGIVAGSGNPPEVRSRAV